MTLPETTSKAASTRRSSRRLIAKAFSVTAVSFAGVALVFLAVFLVDGRRIRDIAISLSPDSSVSVRETAEAIQRGVSSRLSGPSAYGTTWLSQRSFLRATPLETWDSRTGACGEAARLIITLLQARGIAAVRVNLVSDVTGFAHTAVVYRDGSDWWLLDSAFSTPEFGSWARSNRRPFDSIASFVRDPGGGSVYRSQSEFFTRYNYFDFSRAVRNVVVVQLTRRPPASFAALLERPHAIRSMLFAVGALVAWLVAFLIRPRRCTRALSI